MPVINQVQSLSLITGLSEILRHLSCTRRYNEKETYEGTICERAETRQRIIQVAADLLHKQGVHATSPDEIIEASRTGKGQFYHYFKSKEGVIHEVLQAHLEAIKSGSAPVKYEITTLAGLGPVVSLADGTPKELCHDAWLGKGRQTRRWTNFARR